MSNINQDHFQYIEQRFGFLQLFDEMVLSYRVGVCKPDDRIYQHAIAAARCPAAHCLFIDDVQDNIDAARRNGIPAVLYRDTFSLKQDLTLGRVRWNL
jgi:HAD superfamily hydrolase (TIGR01509 family)